MIKNIKLFFNKENNKSIEFAELVREKFIKENFKISDDNYDLGIALGGDGSFIRMVKATSFDNNPYYVGINIGTLGFLQEVKDDELDKLIYEIKEEKYKVEQVGIQETYIKHNFGEDNFYSLNEIVVRDKVVGVLKADVFIENDLLESFTGDAILIATSQGSTAHNLSIGGAIVPSVFSTLQITPLAPINSSVYHTLNNPVIIPSNTNIVIKPQNEDVMVTMDSDYKIYHNVDMINTAIKDKKIKCLKFSHYNFPQKINEKLLAERK